LKELTDQPLSLEVENVKRRFPSHLRLHTEDQASATPTTGSTRSTLRELDEVDMCLRAFAEATSWGVAARSMSKDSRGSKESACGKTSNPAGRSGLSNMGGRHWQLVDNIVRDGILDECDLNALPSVPMSKAQDLLFAIERLVQRLDTAEETIRRQEAELATAVLVTSHPDRQQETADRLESILESTSRSIGAVAAAVYLLDDATSSLKMRSCFGLPRSRLATGPRDLRGSLADLEALLGNAVLLSDIDVMPEWPSPEKFASAIVVPIGTSTMPHGTMWFWCDTTRSYSPTEVEVANLAAGRVMGEIEQSILGHEVSRSRVVQKQIDTASLTQASMLPDMQVLHEDYDVSGWTYQHGSLGGAFHHWDVVPNGMMTVAIGNASQIGPEGCIVATSALSIIRTLWNQGTPPHQILRVINDSHWSMTDADWTIALSLLQINPVTGYGSLCNTGDMQSFIVSSRGSRPIGSPRPFVGAQPDTVFTPSRFILQPGEILVGFTPKILHVPQQKPSALNFPGKDPHKPYVPSPPESADLNRLGQKSLDQTTLLTLVRDLCDESANDIASYIARLLPQNAPDSPSPWDRSLVLIKNVRKAFK
jgi:sigma-B regulation protein RsbU (phosphoserine phosphatase)